MMDQLFCSDMETVALDPLRESTPLANGSPPSINRRSFHSPSRRRPELLIEPPSYADVVFNPFNEKQASREINTSGKHEAPQNFLKITVSDPQKASEAPGSGTYVSYLINTYTDLPEFEGSSFSVRRRFREVVSLAEKLGESYRGYFIPVRPDKTVQLMPRQDFIEQRSEALEKYFCRLAAHPVLRKSPELRQFLRPSARDLFDASATPDASSAMFDSAEEASSITSTSNVLGNGEASRGSKDLFRAFRELKQYVVSDWGGGKPLVVEEDKKILEQKEKIVDFERELIQSSEQAEYLVKAQEDIGTVMGSLGIALSKLGQLEDDHAAVTAGNAAVKASRCYREANLQCMKHLDTFHEYLALMQAVRGALGERSRSILRVQMLKSEIAALQARHEKLTAASMRFFGGDRRKLEEVKSELTSSEAACAFAQAEYERVMARNAEEIERYEAKREVDLIEMIKGFVHTQVGYAEKLGKAWSEVAQNSSSGESSAMSASV